MEIYNIVSKWKFYFVTDPTNRLQRTSHIKVLRLYSRRELIFSLSLYLEYTFRSSFWRGGAEICPSKSLQLPTQVGFPSVEESSNPCHWKEGKFPCESQWEKPVNQNLCRPFSAFFFWRAAVSLIPLCLFMLFWVRQKCTSFHHFDWNYIPYVMCFGSTYLAKENKLILAMLRGIRSITDVSI